MKNSKEIAQQMFAAEVAGRIAFNNGQKRIPHLDKNLNEIIASNAIGESIKTLKSWLKGWDLANFK